MNENQMQNQNNVNNSMNGVPTNVNNIPLDSSISNNNSSIIPPINEVKIEASSSIVENQNLTHNSEMPVQESSNGNNQVSNQPPKNSNKSTILLILLFIFLFSFIMGMPYIQEFVQNLKSDNGLSEIQQQAKEEEEKQKQEEESKKPTPTPESDKTKELVCTANVMNTDNYSFVLTQKLYYNSENQLLNTESNFKYTFASQDSTYNALKKQCDEDSLKYVTHSGFAMACSYDDVNIEMTYQFDLKTFTPIIDGNTRIEANVTYKQDVNSIKSALISQGYTCK